MKHKKHYFKGFTLVELIIVIMILAILSVIAFVSFQNFTKDTRDSTRITDMANVKKALELYSISSSTYPLPDSQIGTGVINGHPLIYVGEFGDKNSRVLKFNKGLQDPLTHTSYVYGTNADQTQYQIASILEGESISYSPLIETTYANIYQAKVEGNYKGFIKFNSGSEVWIANIPSLLFSNTGSVELLNHGTYYIVNNKSNLPYDTSGNKSNTGIIQKINGDELIKEITKSQNASLTGINITTLTKDNFENIFTTGGILESFNIHGNDISDIENNQEVLNSIKNNVKNLVLGESAVSAPKVYANCSFLGETVNHGQSMTAYKMETIDKFDATNTCENNSQERICSDGILSGDEEYRYANCIKGEISNCSASGSYTYNGHAYSIPALNHGSGAVNIVSSNIGENNGIFTYILESISCNDGEYVNVNEGESPSLVSCDTGFGQNGNICNLSQNGMCNNSVVLGCSIGNAV
ncbi:MAG: type IV pilin protein [Candidatus Altimarinota bacterium]